MLSGILWNMVKSKRKFMNKMNDDILNRYIDNELNSSEESELKLLLASSPELQKRLDTLIIIDYNLKKVQAENPSDRFTYNVMAKIRKNSAKFRSQNYFIIFIAGIIFLLCIAVVAYAYITSVNSGSQIPLSLDIIENSGNTIERFTRILSNIFNPEYFSLVGSLISVTVLISGYFFFESHRRVMKRTQSR
jgi:hypothetical protein